ncbi:MAG: four helix bundle protein [Calditrichia bacterium]
MARSVKDFRKLKLWNRARLLTLQIHWITSKFPAAKSAGMDERIKKTCVALCANIANGCSENNNHESIQCLQTSIEMSEKLESLILQSKQIDLLDEETFTGLQQSVTDVKDMLKSLHNKILSRNLNSEYNQIKNSNYKL